MLSQTLQEFYDEGVAEEIAGMCPIMVHHREPDLGDTTAAKAGLTGEQQYYIQTAEAGKESIGDGQGFSQALVRVDEHGDYPLTIRTTWEEKRIIDLDAHGRAALDDVTDKIPAEIERFEEFVYAEAMEHELTEVHGLSPEAAERLLNEVGEAELVDAASVALRRHTANVAVADGGGNGSGERIPRDEAASDQGPASTGTPSSDDSTDDEESEVDEPAATVHPGIPGKSAGVDTEVGVWSTESMSNANKGDTDE